MNLKNKKRETGVGLRFDRKGEERRKIASRRAARQEQIECELNEWLRVLRTRRPSLKLINIEKP